MDSNTPKYRRLILGTKKKYKKVFININFLMMKFTLKA